MREDGFNIAVVGPSYLTAVGLKHLIESMAPFAEVLIYDDFESFRADAMRKHFVHCFVDWTLFFPNVPYFKSASFVTIVLVHGAADDSALSRSGIRYMNVEEGRHDTLASLMKIHGEGHVGGHSSAVARLEKPVLSARETEVLRLVASGCLNKEIADRLGISVTTVVSHRKNITEKLNIKSVPSLTVYAVLHGLVGIDKI